MPTRLQDLMSVLMTHGLTLIAAFGFVASSFLLCFAESPMIYHVPLALLRYSERAAKQYGRFSGASAGAQTQPIPTRAPRREEITVRFASADVVSRVWIAGIERRLSARDV